MLIINIFFFSILKTQTLKYYKNKNNNYNFYIIKNLFLIYFNIYYYQTMNKWKLKCAYIIL